MKKRILNCFLIVSFVIGIFTIDVSAATQSYKVGAIDAEPYYAEYKYTPVKIADKFFTQKNENGKTVVYASDNIEDEGTKIISLSSKYDLNDTLLTNGSKVYYAVGSLPKVTVYSVGTDGKNKKKIMSFKSPMLKEYKQVYGSFSPWAYYNGTLYLKESVEVVELDGRLIGIPAPYNYIYSYNIKTKTLKKITEKEILPEAEDAVVYGRYIYINTHDNESKFRLYAYNMKTKKMTKITDGSSTNMVVSDGKLYYEMTGQDNSAKIYRCALSGKGTKTLVAELPEYSSVDKITSQNIYYERYFDEDWIYSEPQYFCYDVETKTTQRLEFEEYYEMVGDVAYW